MNDASLSVLLVEENGNYCATINRLLPDIKAFNFELHCVADYEAALNALSRREIDLCLMNCRLNGKSGLDLLRAAQQRGSPVPVILLADADECEVALQALREGAVDYLLKSQLTTRALERSVRYAVERKRAEKELRENQERLLQAQKLEAVGRLAGGVAHDFNNLLTAIAGYSEIALRRANGDELLREYLEEIKKASDRAAALTRQLLAFSRKQLLQPKVLNVNEVVADMEKMLRRIIGEDIEILTRLEPSLWRVKIDPSQLEQVILNLALNARDAMPHGGKLIITTNNVFLDDLYVSGHIGVESGEYISLTVSDTGCGIDAETQARIFEPFFTTKELGKGTGLGLATVYGVVKQSGGNIWVYSEPGQGTTFKTYFPRVCEAFSPKESQAAVQMPHGGSEAILLVEDEAILRGIVRASLEACGYKVLAAADAAEALSHCARRDQAIDLILTDVVMPQMNGYQLVEKISALRPGIRALFMSGYTEDAIKHPDSTPFLEKPFTLVKLTDKVREVLDAV
jgi:two-component system cell cycle sensor histidine kinase/response regulator CckA